MEQAEKAYPDLALRRYAIENGKEEPSKVYYGRTQARKNRWRPFG